VRRAGGASLQAVPRLTRIGSVATERCRDERALDAGPTGPGRRCEQCCKRSGEDDLHGLYSLRGFRDRRSGPDRGVNVAGKCRPNLPTLSQFAARSPETGANIAGAAARQELGKFWDTRKASSV